jgi:predicted dehydrogenase
MIPLRFALVGCGGMGRAVASHVVQVDDVKVTAVCDLDAERAAAAAEQFGAEAVADYAAAVERGDVDAVIVATHPAAHRPVVEAAAAAGKHIFCEKPLAPFPADCEAMMAAVEAAGVKAQVGQVCRWHPTHRRLKQMVDEGPLGPVLAMYVERLGGLWGEGHPAWRLSRELSGGTLLEINAHELDFMLWLAGPVKQVSAVGGRMLDERQDYPDVAFVSMTFASGAVGVLQSSHLATIGSYAARFDCRDASAVVEQLFGGEVVYQRREAAESEKVTPAEMAVETPVLGETRAFVKAIREDLPSPVPFAEAKHNVEVANAAYESIATGRTIDL